MTTPTTQTPDATQDAPNTTPLQAPPPPTQPSPPPQTKPVPSAPPPPAQQEGWFSNIVGGLTEFIKSIHLVGKGTLAQAPPPTPEEVKVGDITIAADMSIGELVKVLSNAKGDDEEVINSFEEDAEHPAGNAIRNAWITFFYTVPPISALGIGTAVGIQFAGNDWLSIRGIAIIMMCLVFEAVPVLLMLATSKLISRVMAGVWRSIPGALLTGILFVAVALGSAVAQWVLFEGRINLKDFAQFAGAIMRTFALPLAEIAAAIALPILRRKSLDEHLATIKKKNDAKIAINTQRISSQLDVINAAITTKSTLQKEEDYQKKQDLANRLIDLVTEKVIKDAEQSLNDGDGANSSSYRTGRRY